MYASRHLGRSYTTRFSFAAALAVFTLVAIHHGPAEACFCESPRRTIPIAGARDVPTNTRILLSNVGTSLSLRANGEELAASVAPVWVSSLRSMIEVVPDGELSASTEYTVVTSEGMEVARFSTGNEPDTMPPPAATVTNFQIATDEADHGSCGSETTEVNITITTDPDAVFYGVSFERGTDQVDYLLFPEDFAELGSPSDATCRIPVPAQAGDTTCVRITPYDTAKNGAPPSTECVDVPNGGCGVAGGSSPWGIALTLLSLAVVWSAGSRWRHEMPGLRAYSTGRRRPPYANVA